MRPIKNKYLKQRIYSAFTSVGGGGMCDYFSALPFKLTNLWDMISFSTVTASWWNRRQTPSMLRLVKDKRRYEKHN